MFDRDIQRIRRRFGPTIFAALAEQKGQVMQVPSYTLAERDRRWALARQLMQAEEVEALIACGEHECVEAAPFAPDAYFTNDRPGSIVVFCRDEDPVQLVWSNMAVQTHLEAAKRGGEMWIDPANVRAGRTA